VVRMVPGDEAPTPVADMELRIRGTGSARAQPTDEEGAAEIEVDSPLPPSIEIEGRLTGQPWARLAALDLGALQPPDPSDGIIAVKRSAGSSTGDLTIDAAPEKSALAPPAK